MSIGILLSKQNPDGGWPYVRGKSWTEPTAYALMALLADGQTEAAGRGLKWICASQRADGGWAPAAGIDESTWVTSLVALLPPECLGVEKYERAIAWLLHTSGQESSALYRLRERLLGNAPPPEQDYPGWPWVPGAAAWVGPTSLAILALDKAARRRPDAVLRKRLEAGQHFLLNRMCSGGGWNHGSVRALGYESRPYPETTGMGLAALRGVSSPKVELALRVAKSFLSECRSADALNWLRIGLMAHDQLPSGYCPPPQVPCRTLPETSLDLLLSRVENGRNPIWS